MILNARNNLCLSPLTFFDFLGTATHMNITLPVAISIVSLTVALVGGVPGVVNIWKVWGARPQLVAYLRNATVFHPPGGLGGAGLLLDVTVGNLGTEPLVPLAFNLQLEIGGKWVVFERASIREGFHITTPGGVVRSFLNPHEEDLNQKLPVIARDSSIRGSLVFLTQHVTVVELERRLLSSSKRIECIDLPRRSFLVTLNDDLVTIPIAPAYSQSH